MKYIFFILMTTACVSMYAPKQKDKTLYNYTCMFCAAKYSENRALRDHEPYCKKNPDREQLMCSDCGKIMYNFRSFQTHKRLQNHKKNIYTEKSVKVILSTHEQEKKKQIMEKNNFLNENHNIEIEEIAQMLLSLKNNRLQMKK